MLDCLDHNRIMCPLLVATILYQKNTKEVEWMQREAKKMLMSLETKSYEERIKELGMFNQNKRKLRADMIFLQGLEELSQGRGVDVFSAVSRVVLKLMGGSFTEGDPNSKQGRTSWWWELVSKRAACPLEFWMVLPWTFSSIATCLERYEDCCPRHKSKYLTLMNKSPYINVIEPNG